ncbi:MAG: glycosyltransferase family 4 protein [Rikenellaceae bacterium]
MKILQICSGDLFSTYGGGQVYVKNIVDEFICQRIDVIVMSFVSNECDVQCKNYKGIDLYEVSNDVSEHRLEQVVQIIKPDIIHAHSKKREIVEIGERLNIPVIVTAHHGGLLCPAGALLNSEDKICHDKLSQKGCLKCVLKNTKFGGSVYPIARIFPNKVALKIGNIFRKLPFIYVVTPIATAALNIKNKISEWETIAQKSRVLIAPSYAIQSSMILNGASQEKITVIKHGIPLPKSIERKPLNNKIKFFFVGRISYVKGVHVLLEAFSKVESNNVKLYIVGGAGNKKEECYMRELQLKYCEDKRIEWIGKIEPEKLYETIGGYDIMVHPTICLEVFGLTISESITMGKPVLATRCGGAEMQIVEGVNGWLVAPNDVNEMKSRIETILKHGVIKIKDEKSVISITQHCKTLYTLYEKTID